MRTLEEVMLTPHIKGSSAHYDAIATCKFIESGRVGLTLTARTTLLVGGSKGFEVVMVNIPALKNICDEFQD